MPQQLAGEEVLQSDDSAGIFKRVYLNPNATPEGIAWAACGLWQKKRIDNIVINEKFKNREVTVLEADILRKVNLRDIIQQIKSHGCNLKSGIKESAKVSWPIKSAWCYAAVRNA